MKVWKWKKFETLGNVLLINVDTWKFSKSYKNAIDRFLILIYQTRSVKLGIRLRISLQLCFNLFLGNRPKLPFSAKVTLSCVDRMNSCMCGLCKILISKVLLGDVYLVYAVYVSLCYTGWGKSRATLNLSLIPKYKIILPLKMATLTFFLLNKINL